MRIVLRVVVGLLGLAVVVLVAWTLAIGPVAVYRVIAHGTTTVWDHLEYPGRELSPSSFPRPWRPSAGEFSPPSVTVDGESLPLEGLLEETDALSFVLIREGELLYEWYAPDHGPEETSMLFSVTKSVFSVLLGAAVNDGIIGSIDDPVSEYIPELAEAGFDEVTLEDMLRMDSSLDYVEGDNPFGIHVEFNYTDDLTEDILALQLLEAPDTEFRYKSGDNAVLGLVLDRALGDTPITEYFQERIWDPIGAETGGMWSTDRVDGLERTWCCLATTARDLARIGQLVLNDGLWDGEKVVSSEWLTASFEPAYPDRWPAEYEGSPLANYGFGWWLTEEGVLALGKDGQYLYIDPVRDVVIVRLGERQGDVSWTDVLQQVAASTG